MTTNNVVSDQHSAVIQNTANGQLDFLRFNGSQLQSSVIRDYGLSGWTVVGSGDFNGDGNPDMVAQNNATGQLDFLYLNATGGLTGSALSNGLSATRGRCRHLHRSDRPLPPGQVGPTVVTQLANGQLDFLGFNATGTLVASDLVANTVGLPTAVGVAESFTSWPVFANNGAVGNDNVLVQDAAGNLIAIGFTGAAG